jgi:hypothetical protein
MRPTLGRILAATSLLVLSGASAQAQSPAASGPGDLLCSQYIKAAHSSDILFHQASNWLLGYASGMNAALKASGGAEIQLSSAQLLRSAGDYCEANPTSTVASAASAWSASLPKPAAAAQSGGLYIDLNRTPTRRPLLDRR